VDTASWLSLGASALSAGFIGSTLRYDYDTDPDKRDQGPNFYGYLPSSSTKRTLVFLSMIIFSAMLLLVRGLTLVLLGLTGGRQLVFIFLFADLGFYLFVKIARGDFSYWIPVEGYFLQVVTSLLARVVVKVIMDFTSIVQFRHPNEVGGFYWSFTLALNFATLPFAVWLYGERLGRGDLVYQKSLNAALILLPSIMCMTLIFFFNISSSYRKTFLSLKRGKDIAVKAFKEENDFLKATMVFNTSRKYWMSIEEEVRAWVEANWTLWEEERPPWYTEELRAKVRGVVKGILGAQEAFLANPHSPLFPPAGSRGFYSNRGKENVRAAASYSPIRETEKGGEEDGYCQDSGFA